MIHSQATTNSTMPRFTWIAADKTDVAVTYKNKLKHDADAAAVKAASCYLNVVLISRYGNGCNTYYTASELSGGLNTARRKTYALFADQ